MANTLNQNKEKIIYAEWSDIRDELIVIAKERSKREGRRISESELLREITLAFANKHRKARGKAALDLDPTSAPGGVDMKRGVHRRNKMRSKAA